MNQFESGGGFGGLETVDLDEKNILNALGLDSDDYELRDGFNIEGKNGKYQVTKPGDLTTTEFSLSDLQDPNSPQRKEFINLYVVPRDPMVRLLGLHQAVSPPNVPNNTQPSQIVHGDITDLLGAQPSSNPQSQAQPGTLFGMNTSSQVQRPQKQPPTAPQRQPSGSPGNTTMTPGLIPTAEIDTPDPESVRKFNKALSHLGVEMSGDVISVTRHIKSNKFTLRKANGEVFQFDLGSQNFMQQMQDAQNVDFFELPMGAQMTLALEAKHNKPALLKRLEKFIDALQQDFPSL